MAPYTLIAIFFVLIDRIFKYFAINSFQYKEVSIIGDIFKLSYAENPNIAFSLPLSGPLLFVLIYVILLILVIFIAKLIKEKNFSDAGLLTILLFSAISNIVDRNIYSAVIDYFDLKYFTVFNFADSIIVITAILYIALNIKRE